MIRFALRRSDNVHWQAIDVDKTARAALSGQKPCVLWFTGLSGAGKSTIANLVEKRAARRGHHTYLLDGDNVRHGLNKDLGFTDADRVENIRRVGEVAQLLVDAGLIVIASFISPVPQRAPDRARRSSRRASSSRSSSTRRSRSPRSATRRASTRRRGAASSRTSPAIDSPYEAPESPELHVDTSALTPEEVGAARDRRDGAGGHRPLTDAAGAAAPRRRGLGHLIPVAVARSDRSRRMSRPAAETLPSTRRRRSSAGRAHHS